MASDYELKAKEAFEDDNSDLYADRAQVKIKLNNLTEAVADANKAIELNPSHSKAYTACINLQEYQTAKAALEMEESGVIMPIQEKTTTQCDATKAFQPENDLSEPPTVTVAKPKYRHGFYQKPDEVSVSINNPGEDAYVLQPRLFGKRNILWQGSVLHADMIAGGERPTYPSSKPKETDWYKLEAQVKKEEKEEKLDGDTAVNKLFRTIYQNADEDTRKAMNKSLQCYDVCVLQVESNGTVLSTNWKDVGSKRVEGSPPDGMELKKW
uniref:Suppressor of G2 allele of SKP1 isogeny n=1 Tax=Cajanus cajan TaxID=3821 RepID=A0A151U6D0_CAJCA|nr:Suppressor of G2 allele of SKP1 isogeny [Cajanus cajan]